MKESNHFGYVYITTDTVRFNSFGEPMRYVGQHKFSEFDPTYFGSGTIISKIAAKRPSTLKVELLCWCSSLDEINQKEFEFVNKYGTMSPNGYNLRPGGDQKGEVSPELRKRISDSVKRSFTPDVRNRISLANKSRGKDFYRALSLAAHTPEAISKAQRTRKAGCLSDADYLAACSKRAHDYYDRPGVREAHANKIAAAKTPEVIQKQIEKIREAANRPEHKEKQRQAQLAASKRPEVFAHRSAAQLASMTPERRKHMSEAHMNKRPTEETRAKMSETRKRIFSIRIAAYKKMIEEGSFTGSWNDFQTAVKNKVVIISDNL